MDLRIVKTKKAIREAFLELRQTTPLEKVKVRDICRIALINKSTFYNHYEDVFALSRELEDEALAQCLDFNGRDQLFSDPELFLEHLPKSYEKQKDLIYILFSGREEALYVRKSTQLRDYFKDYGTTPQEEVLLTFLIGGTMYTMQQYSTDQKYSVSELNGCVASFIRAIQAGIA